MFNNNNKFFDMKKYPLSANAKIEIYFKNLELSIEKELSLPISVTIFHPKYNIRPHGIAVTQITINHGR